MALQSSLRAPVLLFLVLTASATAAFLDSEEPIDFATEIRPLLSDRCFQCHGPDAANVEAGLRLDQRASAIEDRGDYAAIVPGDAGVSELIYRISNGDAGERMPPIASKLELEADEIELIRRWIDEGADYTGHWAFEPPVRRPPPPVEDADWPSDALDRFVLAKLEAQGLAPAPQADRATLLRRVSFDLTGLPPTLDELDAFLADTAPDAYGAVVDRLLASTAHAERMTADWLDVARYADTFGYQADVDMNVWPWRDWVLGAFESNLAYDAFLTQQLAGDLIEGATRETRLATTFNRLHRQTNEGGSIEEEFRVEYVSDRVETMAAAFLGLTVACARCHDHKFDPISQRDYYELSSFFDDIDESGLYSHFTRSVPTPALDLPTGEQEARLPELEEGVRRAEARLAGHAALPGNGVAPQGRFAFEPPDVGANAQEGGGAAQLVDGPASVEGAHGRGLRMSGEDAVAFPGIGDFHRSDAFSLGLRLNMPAYERAVVIHRTKSWTDSGSRGYQLLVEEGKLTVALVHFWPGDAIAIRTREPVPTHAWLHVAFSYDGSSRADGLRLYLDGVLQDTEVVRDHLTRTIRGGGIGHLTIGSRFRDKGYKHGSVDDVAVYARELSAADVAGLHASGEALAGESDAAADAAGEALRAVRAERDALRDGVRQIMTMRTSPDLPATRRTAHVLHRGVYSERRAPVAPATLSAFPTLGVEAPRDRRDLARWLTHPDHPTTARVQVDRLWRIAFGRGLLPTPEDLGSQGPVPTHRALLDTLARDLVESGWDSRALLRRFVTSSTYRQSSTPPGGALAVDPGNELFSRAQRGRRPAEMIRDGALRAAGLLAQHRGGASVFPYQPPGLWQEKSGKRYPTSRGDGLRRRSLYTFWRRTSPPPAMAMFDAPAREVCTVARQSTVTPLQALTLWNDPQFVEVAVTLAARAIAATDSDVERVAHLMRSLASRRPTAVEEAVLLELLAEQRVAYRAEPAAAVTLATFDLEWSAHPRAEGDAPDQEPEQGAPSVAADDAIERAATTVVASALLSLDSVVTRR
ncbi:MAG: DUF1549 domain-containing protein [bacterium]|nr:DUF1549 domain-containing protein [bacterium]